MELSKIVVIAIVGVILSLVLKEWNKSFSFIVSVLTCLLLMFIVVPYLKDIISILNGFTNILSTKTLYMSTVVKIIGIAYITEFGASLCTDAGESAIAKKVELGGKVIIMLVSMPIIEGMLNTVTFILP